MVKYIFAIALLSLGSCKKESATCTSDKTVICCNRTYPNTRQEILNTLSGTWQLRRVVCGWVGDQPFNNCLSIVFSQNEHYAAIKNGIIVEQGSYLITESVIDTGLCYINTNAHSDYLYGAISLDVSNQIMVCGYGQVDGCDNYYKKQ